MFCPICKSEYRPGFDRCADCDEPLVDSLAEDAAADFDELVVVLRTTDPALLPIAKSVLAAAGLRYVVQGEAGINVFPLGAAASRVTNRLTGATILVRKADYEEAKALLDRPESG
jgi:hypothetical protein